MKTPYVEKTEAQKQRVREKAAKWKAEHPERVKENGRKRYQAKKEQLKEYARQWRKAHPEQSGAAWKKWKEAHPDSVRESQKRSYAKRDKALLRERRRKYREEHFEEVRAKERAYYEKNYDRLKAQRKAWQDAQGKAHHIRNKYGLSLEALQTMEDTQNGLCAICGRVPVKFHVDHDHVTGRVRGLLCNHCNWGLGHFFDNCTLLQKAIVYLNLGK